jgi:hypothetical protein
MLSAICCALIPEYGALKFDYDKMIGVSEQVLRTCSSLNTITLQED